MIQNHPGAASINDTLDVLIQDSNSAFKNLLIAYHVHTLGQNALNAVADHVLVSATVGKGLQMEPIPISELRGFNDAYPAFVFEVFHGKLVQIWNTCLDKLFRVLLDLHINGSRPFKELGKRNLYLDFESHLSSSEQIRENMSSAFNFFKYSERQKVINTALNESNERESDQRNVRKNVLVRNSFQHRKGIVDDYLLKELGNATAVILDDKGNEKAFTKGDTLMLSMPEIHAFKASIVCLAQAWRAD